MNQNNDDNDDGDDDHYGDNDDDELRNILHCVRTDKTSIVFSVSMIRRVM